MSAEYFDNKYEDFSPGSSCFLNEINTEVSNVLKQQLCDFNKTKLDFLTTELRDKIFYDGSIYTGSAGIAFYYFICATRNGDINYNTLKTALKYIDLRKLKGKRISFLCGDAGPLALASIISFKLGVRRPEELPDHQTLIKRLLSLESLIEESPDELLYGRAGYLYALLFVNHHIGKHSISEDFIKKVIWSIIDSGRQLASRLKCNCPLIWKWHDKLYFGGAHGMAGILYLLLQSNEYIESTDLELLIKPTIDWLLETQYESGNFPSSYKSSSGDRLVQWCHGAPGFVPLLLLCYQIFKDVAYLNKAIDSGEVVWRRGLCAKGYSICHGVSGNAYAFIQLYQATKDPKHLHRACCFAHWCLSEEDHTEGHKPDRPASLFEGLSGRLYFLNDLTHIMNAKFPAFTV